MTTKDNLSEAITDRISKENAAWIHIIRKFIIAGVREDNFVIVVCAGVRANVSRPPSLRRMGSVRS